MNLTEKSIAKLQPGAKRIHVLDESVTGFGLRIEPNGRKSFYWYKKVCGQPQFRALGEVGVVSLKEARDAAVEWTNKAASWKRSGCAADADPFKKEAAERSGGMPTFKELVTAYVDRHLRPNANTPERAVYDCWQLVGAHFEDWLEVPIDKITANMVIEVRDKCGKHEHIANTCVEFTKRVFNWAAASDKDGKLNFREVANPAAKVGGFKKKPRTRFLQPDELIRFNEQLEKETDRNLKDFLTLALATGVRRLNVLQTRWADIRWEREVWHIPHPKNGHAYDVSLTPKALVTFQRRRAEAPESEEFVFPAHSKTGHRVDIKKAWYEFRKKCGLADVRIHDLRRSKASYAAIGGESLQKIAGLLGHKSLGSVQVYANLNQESLRSASLAGDAVMERMIDAAKQRLQLAEPKQPKQRRLRRLPAAVRRGR